MPQKIVHGYKELMAKAEAAVESVSAPDALELARRDDVVIVDIRDIRELDVEPQ
jgi:hypothetical protein